MRFPKPRALAWIAASTLALAGLSTLAQEPARADASAQPAPAEFEPSPCAVAAPGHVRCHSGTSDDTAPAAGVRLATLEEADANSHALTAAQIQRLYNAAPPAGSPTVAIINVGHVDSVEDDLAIYRAGNGLSACTSANGCFKEINQYGDVKPATGPWAGAPPVTQDTIDWYPETALDVDMVSATCPACKILLVDATSTAFPDVLAAVERATNPPFNATYVSMSLGLPSDIDLEHYLAFDFGGGTLISSFEIQDAFSKPGVAYFASSGDFGYGEIGAPATFPSVVAVGGTYVTPTDASETAWTETAWGLTRNGNWVGAGSGCSPYHAAGSAQSANGVAAAACNGKRGVVDISGLADGPDGAALVVLDADDDGTADWVPMLGTSATAPIMASLAAIAGAQSDALAGIYANAGNPALIHDVTGGQSAESGSCGTIASLCHGQVGWDGPTGVGSPQGPVAFVRATSAGTTGGGQQQPTTVYARSSIASSTQSFTASAGGDVVTMTYSKNTKQTVKATYKKKVKGKVRSVTKSVKVAIARSSSQPVDSYWATSTSSANGIATCTQTTAAAAQACADSQALAQAKATAYAAAQEAAIAQATAQAGQARAAAQAKALAAAKKAVGKVKKPTKKDVSAAKKKAAAAAKAAWQKKYAKKKK